MNPSISPFLEKVNVRNTGEAEFLQAVTEVAESLIPLMETQPQYKNNKIVGRMVEPERVCHVSRTMAG